MRLSGYEAFHVSDEILYLAQMRNVPDLEHSHANKYQQLEKHETNREIDTHGHMDTWNGSPGDCTIKIHYAQSQHKTHFITLILVINAMIVHLHTSTSFRSSDYLWSTSIPNE